MKTKAAKRTRIARVRRIQHDLVAADAAKAENHATMLESSAARLAALRNSLSANMGSASGVYDTETQNAVRGYQRDAG